MSTAQNMTKPAMIEVLKAETRGLTYMNKKQMLEINREKGLLEQATKLSKDTNHRKGMEVKLVAISTGEETIFHSLNEASEKIGNDVLVLTYNNRRTWNDKNTG